MRNPIRLTAVALLALAALTAFQAAPAQASGGYTAYGIGTTESSACSNATSGVTSHCTLHGPITTTSLGCIPIYNGRMEFVGYLCRCEASAPFCYNPPNLPFP